MKLYVIICYHDVILEKYGTVMFHMFHTIVTRTSFDDKYILSLVIIPYHLAQVLATILAVGQGALTSVLSAEAPWKRRPVCGPSAESSRQGQRWVPWRLQTRALCRSSVKLFAGW